MSIRIALWGAPCSGKTTLAKALSEKLSLPTLGEYATEWLTQYGGYQAWLEHGPMLQCQFGWRQIEREDEPEWVSDSPAGLSWIYCASRPDREHVDWRHASAECYRIFLKSLARATHHFYLEPIYPYDQNGIRITREQALNVDLQLQATLTLHGVDPIAVAGSIEHRVAIVERAIA